MEERHREWTKNVTQDGIHDLDAEVQKEMEILISNYENIRERRSSPRWSVDWSLEGWVEIDGEVGPRIPLILVDYGPGGVGVIFNASHPLGPGQRGKLIMQSHGGGCKSRPICCRSVRNHPMEVDLRIAGLSFE